MLPRPLLILSGESWNLLSICKLCLPSLVLDVVRSGCTSISSINFIILELV